MRKDVPIQPSEVNIVSTGIGHEDEVFFSHTDDADLPSGEKL